MFVYLCGANQMKFRSISNFLYSISVIRGLCVAPKVNYLCMCRKTRSKCIYMLLLTAVEPKLSESGKRDRELPTREWEEMALQKKTKTSSECTVDDAFCERCKHVEWNVKPAPGRRNMLQLYWIATTLFNYCNLFVESIFLRSIFLLHFAKQHSYFYRTVCSHYWCSSAHNFKWTLSWHAYKRSVLKSSNINELETQKNGQFVN